MRGGGEEQIIMGKKTNEMQPASALTILVIMRRGGGRSRSSSSTTCASAASSSTVAAVVVVVSAYSEAPSSSPSARSSAAGIASTVVSSFVISLSLSLVGYYLRCQILHLSRKCHRQPDKIFGAVKTTSVDTSTLSTRSFPCVVFSRNVPYIQKEANGIPQHHGVSRTPHVRLASYERLVKRETPPRPPARLEETRSELVLGKRD